MAGQITYTQERAESLLLAAPYFEDVEIIPFDKGTIENNIEVALLALKVGVLILPPSKSKAQVQSQTFTNTDIFLKLRCVENVILNRSEGGTGKSVYDIAEEVEATLQLADQPGESSFELVSSSLFGVAYEEGREQEPVVAWDVDFRTNGGLHLSTTRAGLPVIEDDGSGNITITTPTPGVTIRYTTNGKNPGTSANLYTGAFNIGSGVTVKARAWIWGYTVSQGATYTRA